MAPQVHNQCGLCLTASLEPALNTTNSTWFSPASHLLSAKCFLCLPFVGIGHQRFPKVKSCSWAQTSVSSSISSSLFCTAHYCRKENTNCISSPVSMKAEFILKDRFHCSRPAKSFQWELSWCVPTWLASRCPCWHASRPLCNLCPMHPLPNAPSQIRSCPTSFSASHRRYSCKLGRFPWVTGYLASFYSSVGLSCVFLPSHR